MSRSVRGVWWMVLAAFFFAMIVISARRVNHLPAFEMVFLQAVGTVLCMTPWVVRRGLSALRTPNLAIHLIRGAGAALGMAAMFFAVRFMPAADITALLFCAVLFTVLLASLFLHEAIGLRRGIAIVIGFAGALIIIRPGFAGSSWPALIMVFVALSFGAVNVATRFLAGAENPNALVFCMYGLMALSMAVPTAFVWQTPSWADMPWVAALGIVSTIAQQGITRSFALAPAAVVMPAYYLQLPFAALVGYFLFGELPDGWVWLGAAIICAATYYVIRTDGPRRPGRGRR